MASTCDNHPAVCLCLGCAPKRQRFMAQHRAEQERRRTAQHQDEAAHRAAAWRSNRAEARARRRARVQRKRRSILVVSMALCVAWYGPITVVIGLQRGFLTAAIMALIFVPTMAITVHIDRRIQPPVQAWVEQVADRMDAWMECRLVQEWLMHRIWAREWLRTSDAALPRLYARLQQVIPAVTPSPTAKGSVRARCDAPLAAIARSYDRCGAPAGLLTSPAMPATAKSQDPTGLQVFSPPPSADPSPHGKASGPLAVGTVLNGRYRIVRHLGAGAFGRVYRAEDMLDATSPPLAIKELLDDQFATVADKREAVRWFRREVSTLLSLEHPSILKVHAHWTATMVSGPFYLAMDFIPGKTLEETLDEKGQIDWRQAAEWGMSICKALAYLHGQTPPFLFRDLKPANIMIEAATNAPKLIDFGIARGFTARAGQTATGTPGYAPIEQWLGRTEPRSDLYALGAVLHALVSGKKPSAELARLQAGGLDMPEAMKQLFPPLDTLVAGLPPAFVHAVARAVAYDVADRYPDVIALGVALGEALVTSTARAVAAMQA
jgi:Protein kinase domain